MTAALIGCFQKLPLPSSLLIGPLKNMLVQGDATSLMLVAGPTTFVSTPTNMADPNDEHQIGKLKNSEIAVKVEEALNDVIIVSFRHQGRVFQGALLDSTKKELPCGITAPKDFFKPPPPPPVTSVEVGTETTSNNGLIYRHTYFQETGSGQHVPFNFRSLKTQGNKQRQPNKKMTVRLRPRKVLCSNCKSTCNPATESNPPAISLNSSTSTSDAPPRATRRNLRNVDEESRTVTFKEPEFVLLNESRPDNDSCSNSSTEDDKKPEKIKIVGNYWISPTRDTEEDAKDPLAIDESEKMVLRKKRSVGSMEDLWDESIFEEGSKRTKLDPLEPTRTTTPIIKISFGTQGQGTVLKIPAKVQNMDNVENSENESDRAVKKAMKKAKKKKMGSPNSSPTWGEPRKHKHKHLKKHKKSRHRDSIDEQWNVSQTDEEIKEQCLKQRLSISLKRLNATAYMRCDQDDPTPSSSNSPSPDGSEEVPDFPETDLASPEEVSEAPEVRTSSQAVQSYITADGRKMNVGDVVWGKIHGFPWWPGKVLSISISRKEDGVCLSSHAHVSWYGSPTSSWMLCDQLNPFLETFKVRYNKKKRGPYKEAIRQATNEAQQLATVAVPSTSPSQILSVTSSPREVNVLS